MGRDAGVIKIREAAGPVDDEIIRQIHLACFRPAEFYPELLSRGWWWILTQDGVPVGFAGMAPSVRWSDVVYLCRSAVMPGGRGKGLQKRLIRVRLAKAKKVGMNWAITDTRRNPASANSLITCGFRMYQPQHPWSFKDACYWKKELK